LTWITSNLHGLTTINLVGINQTTWLASINHHGIVSIAIDWHQTTWISINQHGLARVQMLVPVLVLVARAARSTRQGKATQRKATQRNANQGNRDSAQARRDRDF
jgi:hypothetical protein